MMLILLGSLIEEKAIFLSSLLRRNKSGWNGGGDTRFWQPTSSMSRSRSDGEGRRIKVYGDMTEM